MRIPQQRTYNLNAHFFAVFSLATIDRLWTEQLADGICSAVDIKLLVRELESVAERNGELSVRRFNFDIHTPWAVEVLPERSLYGVPLYVLSQFVERSEFRLLRLKPIDQDPCSLSR